MNITQATLDDVEALTELFNGYRMFYEQHSDIEGAGAFLRQRLENAESVIFLARSDAGEALGFTQLYPTFSSVSMVRQWILNDLFVAENARKMGVANALMQTAETFAKESGAKGLSLSTAKDNLQAQALYEQRGWLRGEKFYHYNKAV